MHFITGGYFNGKAKWVRDQFGLSERSDYLWLSAYQSNKLELPFQNKEIQLLIIEGVEQYIKKWIDLDIDIQIIRAQAKDLVEKALNWEQAHKNNELILIGTDISKGIVPIEKKDRQWRDITGWVYQDIVTTSDSVYMVWYGISKRIK